MNADWVKKVYGGNYAKPILLELQKSGYVATNGGEISAKMVRDIVAGISKNLVLKKAVYDIVKNAYKLLEEIQTI